MSYLNRENGYGEKPKKVHVGKKRNNLDKLTEPWWTDCAVCPVSRGFKTHVTHEEALKWAFKHVHEEHTEKSKLMCERKHVG